jgi:hypothetical protein
MKHWRAIIATTFAIAGLGLVGMPAFGADIPNPTQPAGFPDPGTLNYVEGSASLDGQALNNKSVGNIELKAGQELTTGTGKAEILLTPGIFLRVDSNSAVKMISPDLAQTQVEHDSQDGGGFYALFTPGPTPQLLPAAQFAMAAADIHHRTPEFRALFQKVLAQLKVFVGTKNDVLLLSCFRHGRHGGLGFEPDLAGRQGAGADGGQVWRALGGPGQGLRLRTRTW